jgi:pyruvate dehydrogenase E2 component (dihydrolipoamide acetyltransferase)
MTDVLDAVTIPKWGIEMTHGTIVAWHKSVGDAVEAGEEIVDIETDKIVNSFEARSSGTLVCVLADVGEELAVGHLIGVIAKEPVNDEALNAFVNEHTSDAAVATETVVAEVAAPRSDVRDQLRIAPALKRKLEKAGLDPAEIVATGPHGRITREDVDRALSQSGAPGNNPESS